MRRSTTSPGTAPMAAIWGAVRMPQPRPIPRRSAPGRPTCRRCSAARSTTCSRRRTGPSMGSGSSMISTAQAATIVRSSRRSAAADDSCAASSGGARMDDMANSSDTSTTETAAQAVSDEEAGRNANRSTTPSSEGFKDFIGNGWADRDETLPSAREQSSFAAARRAKVSAAFPGRRLILPAGDMKQRANDTDYPFRAHSAFAHLTGWGSDSEPGAVLVFEPTAGGHEATVYFRERAGRDSEEFYANPAIGEFWIGARPSLAHVAADLDVATRGLDEFDHVVDA